MVLLGFMQMQMTVILSAIDTSITTASTTQLTALAEGLQQQRQFQPTMRKEESCRYRVEELEVGKTIYDSIPHMHSIECANNKILDVWGVHEGLNKSFGEQMRANGNLIYSNTQL